MVAVVVLQVRTVLDAASALLLLIFIGSYIASWAFAADWWRGFWSRVSRQLDRLRETHWLLPAVVVALGLAAYDAIAAELNAGTVTLLFWFVLAGYASWLFTKRHLLARLDRDNLHRARVNADRDDSETDSADGIPSSGRLR